MTRHVRVVRLTWHFKAAFGDDVPLDLSGPAADDKTELEHIAPLPRPAVPLTRAVVIEYAQFAHGVDCQRGYLVSEFTALQLDDPLRHAARLSPKAVRKEDRKSTRLNSSH